MSQARRLLLLAVALVFWGPVLGILGTALYLRSPVYRRHCAAVLTRHLGLPSEIGGITPLSRRAREFRDVRIWLPERRDDAAFCERAVARLTPTPADRNAWELELTGGRCEISTRTWLREDYRFVLESGLRPGFDPDGPRRVTFRGFDVAFERGQFAMTLSAAQGVVAFDDPTAGRAVIDCRTFNGHTTTEPVTLSARFSPQTRGVRLDSVELVVPRLPIGLVGLRDLAGVGLESGRFEGRLSYGESDGGRTVTVRGRVQGVPLAELTAGLMPQAWHGEGELELDELTLRDDRFECVRLRGVLTGLLLGDLLAPLGGGEAGGTVTLRVMSAEVSRRGIERLVVSGRCDDVSLAGLTQGLGHGTMTGRARVVIQDLTVIDNRLASLDADLFVEPMQEGRPNWIDRALLAELLERALGVRLPAFVPLPERLEYSALGARLEVRDEVLQVFGSHGPRRKTILTVRIADTDLPLVFEPENPIPLAPWLAALRARAAEDLHARLAALAPTDPVRRLWEGRPPAGAPAPEPAHAPHR